MNETLKQDLIHTLESLKDCVGNNSTAMGAIGAMIGKLNAQTPEQPPAVAVPVVDAPGVAVERPVADAPATVAYEAKRTQRPRGNKSRA